MARRHLNLIEGSFPRLRGRFIAATDQPVAIDFDILSGIEFPVLCYSTQQYPTAISFPSVQVAGGQSAGVPNRVIVTCCRQLRIVATLRRICHNAWVSDLPDHRVRLSNYCLPASRSRPNQIDDELSESRVTSAHQIGFLFATGREQSRASNK